MFKRTKDEAIKLAQRGANTAGKPMWIWDGEGYGVGYYVTHFDPIKKFGAITEPQTLKKIEPKGGGE